MKAGIRWDANRIVLIIVSFCYFLVEKVKRKGAMLHMSGSMYLSTKWIFVWSGMERVSKVAKGKKGRCSKKFY